MGIKPEEMTDEVWSFIFKRGAYPAGCSISEENLLKMRSEFEYWYPMDLRCSAKDLIRNHLSFSLYNHAAIWEDHKFMPRGFFANGYVLVNGEKMSKSAGNFFTIRDCIDKYGVDATRMALADAGDSLDDANFDEMVANASILRLFVFDKWIQEETKKNIPTGSLDFS
jgi:leucyl-tRNA synthetase